MLAYINIAEYHIRATIYQWMAPPATLISCSFFDSNVRRRVHAVRRKVKPVLHVCTSLVHVQVPLHKCHSTHGLASVPFTSGSATRR